MNKEDKDAIKTINNKIKILGEKYYKIKGQRNSLAKIIDSFDDEMEAVQIEMNALMDNIEEIMGKEFADDNKRKAHKRTTR